MLPASNWFSLQVRPQALPDDLRDDLHGRPALPVARLQRLVIMLLARVVQGAGGGALQPLSQAILLEIVSAPKRGAAMAVFAFGVVVAPVLGPTLGGWLTDTYSWRYAFYINIPIGLLALFMISRFINDPPLHPNAKVPAVRQGRVWRARASGPGACRSSWTRARRSTGSARSGFAGRRLRLLIAFGCFL